MTKLCAAIVKNDSFQSELIVLWVALSLLLISGVVVDIQICRELQP